MFDQTMCPSFSRDLAGETRTDQTTGEIADRNVIWLTSYDENTKAGGVKTVSLPSGAYCVMWTEYKNAEVRDQWGGTYDDWVNDGLRYVLLDETGHILKNVTAVREL